MDIYNKFGIKEMEVSDEVFESSASKVFEQAENRMHAQKGLMTWLLQQGNRQQRQPNVTAGEI